MDMGLHENKISILQYVKLPLFCGQIEIIN